MCCSSAYFLIYSAFCLFDNLIHGISQSAWISRCRMIAFAIDVRIVRIVVDFGLLCTYLARCCCVNLRRHEACILLKVLFFFFRVQSRKIKHNIKRVNACLKGVFPKMMGEGAVLGGSAIPRQPVARAKRASKSHGRVTKISLIYEPGVAWHIRC